jgi:hypothetical protein
MFALKIEIPERRGDFFYSLNVSATAEVPHETKIF